MTYYLRDNILVEMQPRRLKW